MLEKIVREWRGPDAFAAATREAGVEVGDDGVVRLVRRVVLADEIGDCNGRDVQPIDGRTWARKDFWLESTETAGARVSPWVQCQDETARLVVEVNGHPQAVQPVPKSLLVSPDHWIGEGYWQANWRTVEVPPAWLRPGLNTVILRTEDGSRWEVLIETSRFPNRSAKSADGGQTWDYDHLGYNECYDGEYLVRMELDRYPDQGQLTSPPFDLAASDDGLGQPLTLRRLTVEAETDTPAGTAIRFALRAGPTSTYDPARWSPWRSPAEFSPRPGDRFAQWQATLRTVQPLATPWLRAVRVAAEAEVEGATWARLLAADNKPILYPSHPFGYQAPSPRTAMLRERWHLDDVVADVTDDFEGIVRLAHWTREQWTDGWNKDWKALHFCPPWDTPLILELGRHDLARGMCTHYATVFVHACAALGIPARHLIHKCHCTAEAWSDRWGKWVWMDVGGDLSDETMAVYHVERQGVPLSPLEARAAWLAGDLSDLRLVGRNAEQVFPIARRLELLDRFCIVLRNDQMTSLNPGEPEHGAVTYQYDGYLWWRDEGMAPLPWFSLSSSRAADFYWTPNRTHIHLQRTAAEGIVKVQLESSMPNLAALQVRQNEGNWEERPAEFTWTLRRGENRLAARSHNAFGVQGPESRVVVGF